MLGSLILYLKGMRIMMFQLFRFHRMPIYHYQPPSPIRQRHEPRPEAFGVSSAPQRFANYRGLNVLGYIIL